MIIKLLRNTYNYNNKLIMTSSPVQLECSVIRVISYRIATTYAKR